MVWQRNRKDNLFLTDFIAIKQKFQKEYFTYLCICIHLNIETMNLSIILGMVGGWQIAIIVLVILLLFGGKKIPELMRGLGRGVKEFKDGIGGEEEEEKKSKSEKEIK